MGIEKLDQIFDSNFILNFGSSLTKDDVLEVFKSSGIDITIRILVKFMREKGAE
jgi:RNA recognition motif-containing protein